MSSLHHHPSQKDILTQKQKEHREKIRKIEKWKIGKWETIQPGFEESKNNPTKIIISKSQCVR